MIWCAYQLICHVTMRCAHVVLFSSMCSCVVQERGVLAKEVTELRMRLEPSEELTKQADDQIKGLR